MKYPKFLKPGGTIAFAAPSFGVSQEPYRTRLKNALRWFEAMGFRTDPGPNIYLSKGVGISNTPEKCARELEEYYEGHGDVLISVSGGELMCETLGALDLERIARAEPKWYLGFSDNTNFGFLLPTVFDTASLYGPNAPDFGTEPLHPNMTDCWNLLRGESLCSHGYDMWQPRSMEEDSDVLGFYHLTEKTKVRAFGWDGAPIEGRFVGGCLDILEYLCGTRFDNVKAFNEKYGKEGIVWFMEACDLNPICIRRSLWHLREAGWFDCAKAFVFGRPLRMDEGADMFGIDEYVAAQSMLQELRVPILMDADIGHLPPAMTMVNGGYGVLTPYGEDNIQIAWQLR